MTTNLIPTAQSTFVPAVAKLVTSCCQSNNVVHRQVTSRVGVFALVVLALNETAFQSTLVLAKIPFAMLKVVYDALAPNPLPEALGFKAVGEHVERVKQFAEILFIDTAPMLASPTDIGAICIERGLVKGPSHFETLKQHVWTHRHTILKAGIVLAGAYISYRYLTAPTVVLPPSPANPPAPSPSSAPAVQPTPPTTSAVLAPTPAPTLASIAPTPVNAKQRPSPWTDRLTPLVPPLPFLAAARISETTVMPTLTPVALPDASVPTPSVTPMPSPLSNQTQQPTVGTTSPSPKPIPTPTPATVVISLQNNSAVPRTLSSTIMQSIAPLWTFTRVYLFPSAVVLGVSLVAHQMFKRYKAEKIRLATEAEARRQLEAAAVIPEPPEAPVDDPAEGNIAARMLAYEQAAAARARAAAARAALRPPQGVPNNHDQILAQIAAPFVFRNHVVVPAQRLIVEDEYAPDPDIVANNINLRAGYNSDNDGPSDDDNDDEFAVPAVRRPAAEQPVEPIAPPLVAEPPPIVPVLPPVAAGSARRAAILARFAAARNAPAAAPGGPEPASILDQVRAGVVLNRIQVQARPVCVEGQYGIVAAANGSEQGLKNALDQTRAREAAQRQAAIDAAARRHEEEERVRLEQEQQRLEAARVAAEAQRQQEEAARVAREEAERIAAAARAEAARIAAEDQRLRTQAARALFQNPQQPPATPGPRSSVPVNLPPATPSVQDRMNSLRRRSVDGGEQKNPPVAATPRQASQRQRGDRSAGKKSEVVGPNRQKARGQPRAQSPVGPVGPKS